MYRAANNRGVHDHKNTDAKPDQKRSKLTDEQFAESDALKKLWHAATSKRTQAEFGEFYGLGNQANVGHYMNRRNPLNHWAALAFAHELRCRVSDFSPRLAEDLAKAGIGGTSAEQARPWPLSQEVLLTVQELEPADLVVAENVLRSHLRMPTLPAPTPGESALTEKSAA